MVKRRSPFTTLRAIAGVSAAAAAAALVVAGCSMPANPPETRSPSPPTRVAPPPKSSGILVNTPVGDAAAPADSTTDTTFTAPAYGGEDTVDTGLSPSADTGVVAAVAPDGAIVYAHVTPIHAATVVAPALGPNEHAPEAHDKPSSPHVNITPAPVATPVSEPATHDGDSAPVPVQLRTVAVDSGTWWVLAEVAVPVPGHDREDVVSCQLLDTTTAGVLDEATGSVADDSQPVANMELTAQLTLTAATNVAVSCTGATDGSIIHGTALVAVAAAMPTDQVSASFAQAPLSASETSVATISIGAGRWLTGFRVSTAAGDATSLSCRLAVTGEEQPLAADESMDQQQGGSLASAVIASGPATVQLLCRANSGDTVVDTGVLWALLPDSTQCTTAVAETNDDPPSDQSDATSGALVYGSLAGVASVSCPPTLLR